MLRHLFKLIWNKKKTHSLLIVEIWASFLVLFGLTSLIVYNVRNYAEPLGFTYENVWAVNLNNNQDTTEVAQQIKAVSQRLKAYPEVESVSRMGDNIPFSTYHNYNGVTHNGAKAQVSFYQTDENFAQTLHMPLVTGNWYRNADSIGKYQPAVINRKAKEALFGDENPIGKTISNSKGDKAVWRVMGVVDTFKGRSEFMENEPTLFELLDEGYTYPKSLLVRVKPGTDASFEARMVRDVTAMIRGWSVEVIYLTDLRKNRQNQTLVPVVIFLIVSGFLLINVALGLFGVLNVSIARRRGEIGLRRALGATEGSISRQFVGEMWVLSTFALVLGLLFAGQFPLLNVFDLDAGVYLTAMAVSVVVIYLLVTLCALFPSRQASTVQPAVALHEE